MQAAVSGKGGVEVGLVMGGVCLCGCDMGGW